MNPPPPLTVLYHLSNYRKFNIFVWLTKQFMGISLTFCLHILEANTTCLPGEVGFNTLGRKYFFINFEYFCVLGASHWWRPLRTAHSHRVSTARCQSGGFREEGPHVSQQRLALVAFRHPGPTSSRC